MTAERDIAPLAILRIAFGAILFISTLRFILKGWVYEFYIAPAFHFPFIEGLHPLPAAGMYAVFGIMLLSALFMCAGLFYKPSTLLFFLSFTYVELLDKTYYLNHYYFVSIFTFLLWLAPANRSRSLDVLRRPALKADKVPAWAILIFQLQLCIVYFYAGLSKLTADWLLNAMPLRIWLPANSGLPLVGSLFTHTWLAYVFSSFGALFDLSIGFLLLYGRTRKFAYFFVILFHLLTAWLFKIGMFPYIMIAATLVFFPFTSGSSTAPARTWQPAGKMVLWVLAAWFLVQLIVPFRFLLYPGKLLWTEQGFRFSWRVMLMEKSGSCFFYVKDPASGHKGEVDNHQFLTRLQEKMMATQPDMMVQYAHYLRSVYTTKSIPDPVITVESYVTLNGSGSRLYIDSTADLSKKEDDFSPKKWILPFQNSK